jgi:hypothetical protein
MVVSSGPEATLLAIQYPGFSIDLYRFLTANEGNYSILRVNGTLNGRESTIEIRNDTSTNREPMVIPVSAYLDTTRATIFLQMLERFSHGETQFYIGDQSKNGDLLAMMYRIGSGRNIHYEPLSTTQSYMSTRKLLISEARKNHSRLLVTEPEKLSTLESLISVSPGRSSAEITFIGRTPDARLVSYNDRARQIEHQLSIPFGYNIMYRSEMIANSIIGAILQRREPALLPQSELHSPVVAGIRDFFDAHTNSIDVFHGGWFLQSQEGIGTFLDSYTAGNGRYASNIIYPLTRIMEKHMDMLGYQELEATHHELSILSETVLWHYFDEKRLFQGADMVGGAIDSIGQGDRAAHAIEFYREQLFNPSHHPETAIPTDLAQMLQLGYPLKEGIRPMLGGKEK